MGMNSQMHHGHRPKKSIAPKLSRGKPTTKSSYGHVQLVGSSKEKTVREAKISPKKRVTKVATTKKRISSPKVGKILVEELLAARASKKTATTHKRRTATAKNRILSKLSAAIKKTTAPKKTTVLKKITGLKKATGLKKTTSPLKRAVTRAKKVASAIKSTRTSSTLRKKVVKKATTRTLKTASPVKKTTVRKIATAAKKASTTRASTRTATAKTTRKVTPKRVNSIAKAKIGARGSIKRASSAKQIKAKRPSTKIGSRSSSRSR